MPDKRQTSKQRRAARNRAQREALAARREHAATADQGGTATTSSGAATSGAGRGAGRRAGLASAVLGRSGGTRGPGDTAVVLALVFAVVAAGLSIVAALDDGTVPVDHEGEPLGDFAAVSREAYAILNDTEPVTETTSYFDAAGPVVLVFMILPVLVAAGAFISHRRRVQSRPLTIGLIGMALVTIVNPFSIYFLPSLIALAVAGFQVRKVEMPARVAQRQADQAGKAERDEGVIDVDEVEAKDEDDDDPAETRAGSDERDAGAGDVGTDERSGGDDAGDRDGGTDDVLAELEAEVEADGRTDQPDSEADGDRRPGTEGRSSGR